MKSFPPEVRFRFAWRPYQRRVLDELQAHLTDQRLHVVAPPGSGKTVLGLEVARRLDRPTLFLAPTLTIRDQWVERFVDCFLPDRRTRPDWISKNLDRPGFLTVSTYQALFGLHTRPPSARRAAEATAAGRKKSRGPGPGPFAALSRAEIGTIVMDEAHHLKQAWWESLVELERHLRQPVVVALTATPPYDVSLSQWRRYASLCGPVDSQIDVPELVAAENLCPHQDYVYFCAPTTDEQRPVIRFHREMRRLLEDLTLEPALVDCIESHPWVTTPLQHLDELTGAAPLLVSLLVYLKRVGRWIEPETLALLEWTPASIPAWDLGWLQTLLTGMMFGDPQRFEAVAPLARRVRRRLDRMGAIERRKVTCRSSPKIDRAITASISKLDGIAAIVEAESRALKSRLRMVVLTDFIYRSDLPTYIDDLAPLQRIGVVPIFERLRRNYLWGIRLGVLCGSLVIVPESAVVDLQILAVEMDMAPGDLGFEPLGHDPGHLILTVSGASRDRIVALVTALFAMGQINLLVGSKSLLGEGWDAPCINSLVLATWVGSYVLSNQMRGRAIRMDPGDPEKVANVWHLVGVEPDREEPGSDMQALQRRFKAFVGVAQTGERIANGIGRLGLKAAPYSVRDIEAVNRDMLAQAASRDRMRSRWQTALPTGRRPGRMIEEIRAPRQAAPGPMVWRRAPAYFFAPAVLAAGLMMAVVWVCELETAVAAPLLVPLVGGCLAGGLFFLPGVARPLWQRLRWGPGAAGLRQMGAAVLEGLIRAKIIRTDSKKLTVVVESRGSGTLTCRLAGASRREKAVFLDALHEMVEPMENPRYLLVSGPDRKGPMGRKIYPVPADIARRKAAAEFFHARWNQSVGRARLVGARTEAGKKILLTLKIQTFSRTGSGQSAIERTRVWKA